MTDSEYKGMKEFYPYYLGEHDRPITKVFHVIGTIGFVALVVLAVVLRVWWLALVGVVAAYAFAWFSHFVFEKNRPATFRYPFLSLFSDFRMAGEILAGRRKLGSDD
jgi:hypothetical protein